jgi:hypothetical protein
MRHPDEILRDIKASVADNPGDYKLIHGYIWEIIEDVIDSAKLALTSLEYGLMTEELDEVIITVEDYVSNHYGDE